MINDEKIIDNKKPQIDENRALVEIINVSKVYKNKKALDDVSLIINPGDRIGVIGPNGGGKSTLSEIIGGIRKPTTGKVTRQENMTLGLQFQESKYPIGITVLDMIKYYLETFNIPMTEENLNEILKKFQIDSFKKKFLEGLSGGQQQRVNILLSLIHNPDLVIFDEISTGLDIEVRSEIFDAIKENVINKNKAMILVTHMMSEIEELCEKYIYIHNGVIKERGLVKDLVAKYGSVHNFTWKKFKEEKAHDMESISEVPNKKSKNRLDRIINSEKDKGKNIPLIKLLLKYYYKGFAVPFFLFFFPLILLFLEGFVFKMMPVVEGQAKWTLLHNLIGSLALMQIISVGIFIVPQTILEFKNSVLMKRIGATNIKPIFFILTVVLMGIFFMIIGFLWTLLWAGIMFGNEFGWANVALPYQIGESLPFLLLTLVQSVSLGMLLASIFKSTTTYIAVSNVLYMPIAFLSGSFIPIDLIMASSVLKYATYLNIFKYCMDPFISAWAGRFVFNVTTGVYLGVSLAMVTAFTLGASFKLKWES
ncbi:ABC transporter ATP-binding protein/permease [Spiroplasma floricola]|uniref:ABC transporter ATP-binding protein n=1 Tax=Spiroplasma floricola 23-6 TaxID=1336749 RepID=A0A2K8SD69_9MOLU|nr:ABC transporter ATP-binding protein/permease [Spiroplasma floricola]AUB31401.1 ABC transporter ATP-binding protein [Spiroplasma floricola 23-6]